MGEASEFAAEGVWVRGAEQGTWHAVLGIDGTGAISGRVGFRGLTDFPKGNLLATWSAGGIQKGFLFYQGTIARAGRLRGGIGLNGVSGEFTLPGGAVATWRLQSIRATRQKFAPVRAGELLARGSPAAVMVTIDDYPAVRAARERVADLARYEWDSDAAQIAYESAVADLQESVLRTLAGSAALLLSTPVGCPNFNFICRTVPRSPPSCPCPRSKRCKIQGCTSLPSSKACP
ncbi:MAG: hypothetical protein N3C12_14610 [Candidatus Binatia bacterium]|nr:hypothetical protein [Candidatus Binatia bacterium]